MCAPGEVGLVKAAGIHVLRKGIFYRLQVVEQIADASCSRLSGGITAAKGELPLVCSLMRFAKDAAEGFRRYLEHLSFQAWVMMEPAREAWACAIVPPTLCG
jgi:hypothetical protein